MGWPDTRAPERRAAQRRDTAHAARSATITITIKTDYGCAGGRGTTAKRTLDVEYSEYESERTMPVATTTQAGRQVLTPEAEKILNDRERARQAAAKRADVLTPLGIVGKAPLETIPEPPAETQQLASGKTARKFSISTEIAYRGRVLTVTAEGMTIDQFCDLMDDRQYQAPAPLMLSAPLATPDDLPEGYKLCRKHGAPMRPRNKQGEWWHSHNVGTAENPCWCKGYKGSDSPGYDL